MPRKTEKASPAREALNVVLSLLAIGAFVFFWIRGSGRETAGIRQMTSTQIFMDDGTVWETLDGRKVSGLAITSGDRVRYENMNPKQDDQNSDGEMCGLVDTTTGAQFLGIRTSAPFKHSSCPYRSALVAAVERYLQ